MEIDYALPDAENLLQLSSPFGVNADYLIHDEYISDGNIFMDRQSRETVSRRIHSLA